MFGAIAAGTVQDGAIVGSSTRWLVPSADTWTLVTAASAPTGAYRITYASAALIAGGTRRSDGSFDGADGVQRWLVATTLGDGAKIAVAIKAA